MIKKVKHCFHTSVGPPSHIESAFIFDKIARSCFLSAVIQLTCFTEFEIVVALTGEFAVAEHETFVRILNPFCFKGVTLKSSATQ